MQETLTEHIVVTEPLPDTPSVFLTWALKCLKQYEDFCDKPAAKINGLHFAVAEMLAKPGKQEKLAMSAEFIDPNVRRKLGAMRSFARGDVHFAINLWPTEESSEFYIDDEHYVTYDDCKVQFKKQMRCLIGELKLAGI